MNYGKMFDHQSWCSSETKPSCSLSVLLRIVYRIRIVGGDSNVGVGLRS